MPRAHKGEAKKTPFERYQKIAQIAINIIDETNKTLSEWSENKKPRGFNPRLFCFTTHLD
jgi:hypothetical protein